MSYRDDRDAVFARLEATLRENEKLRDHNVELQHTLDMLAPPVEPPSSEPNNRDGLLGSIAFVVVAAITFVCIVAALFG